MKTSNVLRRVYGVTAALLGVHFFFFFFFFIVGVFGLTLAIAELTNPFLYRRSTATLYRSGDWVSCETYVRMSPEIMVH